MSAAVLRPSGERAVLVELDSLTAAHALSASILAAELPGVLDVVPAARTVLVTVHRADQLSRVATRLQQLAREPGDAAPEPATAAIPVVYDGADLAEVARLTSLSTAEVIARHSAATYTADFLGFAPGFAYLSGLDQSLHVPRLDSPRTAVPAGAVAIAGEYSAVYPRTSPGGWHLIGHTDTVMFDPAADPPARLQAGMRVRFEAVR
ncbi:5-oxoprolinase subunit PxpB [Ruania zhangjianzhongii]|uniref:5-oxoprolinase subunit PxpB n=1 Tax=Ruania zhangjianzhongii TaxID=2603206 RepID=UPI0011CA6671|nr:5-oxoprolinase subunit PxpB [Ruania zhangjianzhongii]